MSTWNFPKIFKGNAVDVISGAEGAISNMQLLVNSELFEFRYDPAYGSNVPLLLFRPKTKLTKDLIVDAVYELQNYCPNIRFDRNQVTVNYNEPAKATIYIPAIIDNQDHITDIVLYAEATQE